MPLSTGKRTRYGPPPSVLHRDLEASDHIMSPPFKRPPSGASPGQKPWSKRPPQPHREAEPEDAGRILFGIHAVEAALANPRRTLRRLHLTENAERRLAGVLAGKSEKIERVSPRDLDRRFGADTVHQGVLMETEPLEDLELADIATQAGGRPLVILDQVTDPHNAGAIFRSAAVFGAAGVVMTRRHSPPLGGVLAKSASGALEHVPVALVQNLAKAMEELKDMGYSLIGLDGEAPDLLDDLAWPAHSALVLGAEGKGLRQLTRETCTHACRIGTDGPIASLNVSNAAAIGLHLAAMRRRGTA